MDACNERSAQRWWPRRGERGGGDQERLKLVEGARQLGIEEEERLLGAPEEREGCEAVDLSAHHLRGQIGTTLLALGGCDQWNEAKENVVWVA